MKVVVKKKDNSIPVAISTEFIKLQDALKFANVVYSGGEVEPHPIAYSWRQHARPYPSRLLC